MVHESDWLQLGDGIWENEQGFCFCMSDPEVLWNVRAGVTKRWRICFTTTYPGGPQEGFDYVTLFPEEDFALFGTHEIVHPHDVKKLLADEHTNLVMGLELRRRNHERCEDGSDGIHLQGIPVDVTEWVMRSLGIEKCMYNIGVVYLYVWIEKEE